MSDDPLIGQTLGNYRLESLLGQGGMARVYWGVDAHSKRQAAVKVMEAAFRDESDYRERFEREAEAISRLHHPNIVHLYSYGEAARTVFIAMQYVYGTDLASALNYYQKNGSLMRVADVCRIMAETASALDYAHQHGIIHRDVKPSNILIDQQGHITLTDFGLALLTDVGTRGEIFGTPFYIAPEQAISSAGALPQSDQYSLGVILYEMLTGRVPFDGGSPLDTAILHITQPPPTPREFRPELSTALEAVVLKALEKKPDERYGSCVELASALEKAVAVSNLSESPITLTDCIGKTTISRPTLRSVAPDQKSLSPKAQRALKLPLPGKTQPAPRARQRRGPRLGWIIFFALLFSIAAAALLWGGAG